MKIVVITDDNLKKELFAQGLNESAKIEWSHDIENISKNATACVDLLFDTDREKRKELLIKIAADTVIVNDVTGLTENLPANFIRINGWPTFLKRGITEASCNNEAVKEKAEKVFSFFNKKIEWVPDIHGFITPRVICTIINEAYFSLEDNVSSREEIDIAMRTGTNYPMGPFEWASRIGVGKVLQLLQKMNEENGRYNIAPALISCNGTTFRSFVVVANVDSSNRSSTMSQVDRHE